MSSECQACLLAYSWPGNVRELRNAMERALVLCSNGVVRPADLPPRVSASAAGGGAWEADPRSTDTPQRAETRPLPAPSDIRPMEEVEKRTIEEALAAANGNVSVVIRKLGIPRTTLYRKLRQYGIKRP